MTRLIQTHDDNSVRVLDEGAGPAIVFLHGGVGSPAEWQPVLSRWPHNHRRIAIDASGEDAPGRNGGRTLDDWAAQVLVVAEHVGEPVHLVGFSWGGATALRVATTAPWLLSSLTVVEPQAYSLLRTEHPDTFAKVIAMRDRWRAHVAAGRWHAAFAEFIDHYNGSGSFDAWPEHRREAFLSEQRSRGDLWDVLVDSPLVPDDLATVTTSTLVVEGGETSDIERALCEVVRHGVPACRHVVIERAGHMIPRTHPDALTELLLQHLDRQDQGG